MQSPPRPKGREAVKAWNRHKIVDATLEVVTRHGIAGLTIARVVALAGVSMGLVNAHFRSKEALLHAVLAQLADDYKRHWRERLERAPAASAARLAALVEADLDSVVVNQRTLGVWFAFRAQSRAQPEYLDLVGTRERDQFEITVELLHALNRESGLRYDPRVVARLLAAMIEGIWTDAFLYPGDSDRQQYRRDIFLFLETMYPGRFATVSD